MSRQTPTSRRSPSILVTDVRHQKAHSAPFVSRRLNSVSIESLLSNTSEVPSAQRRVAPKRAGVPAGSTSNYGRNSHRSRMAGGSRRSAETTPLLDSSLTTSYLSNGSSETTNARRSSHSSATQPSRFINDAAGMKNPVKPVPQLSKPLPSRTSKQSQRLVLIPEANTEDSQREVNRESSKRRHSPNNVDNDDTMRVTSYLISEGVDINKAARYLKDTHRARVRLYDEALFVDYLLPLLPGNGVDFRVMSSMGDNRTMERLIDISEQGDHHFEYFSASGAAETDPSEPQDFSPRPNDDAPIRNPHSAGAAGGTESSHNVDQSSKSRKTHQKHHEAKASIDTDTLSVDGDDHEDSGDNSLSTNSESSDTETETHKKDANNEFDYDSDRHRREQQKIEERKQWVRERMLERYTSHAEIFVFNYGVVVFWNFTEAQEKQILADLCIGGEGLIIQQHSDQEIQSEELGFTYSFDEGEKPKIFNDLITLNSNSHMLKLAMSHAMAQSTILCGFEDRMQAHLKDVRGVPKSLALTGKLGLNREQLLRISGRLFKLRVDVNLSSNVLDIPEFFWDSEPSLFPLFNALREYLEIDERVLVLNERQSVFLELTSILGDSIAEFNMDRITIIVIWLIALSICVSLTEIAVRFLILKRANE